MDCYLANPLRICYNDAERMSASVVTMDKKQIYILIAVVVVLLFMIEPFAIGMMQSGSNAGGAIENNGNAVPSAASFTGSTFVNMTITGYTPYIIVSGNSSGIESVKQGLIDEGVATYAVKQGEKLVVSLKNGKSVIYAAGQFRNANATVIATMQLSTPGRFNVSDGTNNAEVEGTTFAMQADPVYEEGSVQEASFPAQVDGGKLMGIGTLSFRPAFVSGAAAEATLLPDSRIESEVVEVSWANRTVAKKIAQQEGAAYKERSFMLYSGSATPDAVLASAGAAGYMTGAQQGIISVRNDFSDEGAAMAALSPLGIILTFPPSLASFANNSAGNADALLAKLSLAGVNATVSKAATVKIVLPDEAVKGGEAYRVPASLKVNTIDAAGIPQNASAVNVTFDFEAAGSAVYAIAQGSIKVK